MEKHQVDQITSEELEEEEEETEDQKAYSKETMGEHFSSLEREMNIHIQEVRRSQNKMVPEKFIPKYSII
jgi:hypothetical protein